jgi:hypothetical protein
MPYILESNPHPNLVRTSFADFLNEKKVSSRFQSAPFLQPPLAYKADWLNNIGWRITIQLWVMTASRMINKL